MMSAIAFKTPEADGLLIGSVETLVPDDRWLYLQREAKMNAALIWLAFATDQETDSASTTTKGDHPEETGLFASEGAIPTPPPSRPASPGTAGIFLRISPATASTRPME